jgi:N-alpha-acetyltransferase 38, NatC auxiliary subunit
MLSFAYWMSTRKMEKSQAEDYLTSLLGKTLRVTTNDTRMFLGQFKCTDSVRLPILSPQSPSIPYTLPPNPNSISNPNFQDRNIILSSTFEYRLPPPPKNIQGQATVTMDMTSRYLGLVVVPGEYIVKIEVEEFASQVKGKGLARGSRPGTSSSSGVV